MIFCSRRLKATRAVLLTPGSCVMPRSIESRNVFGLQNTLPRLDRRKVQQDLDV